MPRSPRTDDSRLLGIVAAVVCVGALYFGRVIFVPIVLALLFSLLLAPVVGLLEQIRLPRIAAILMVVAVLLSLIGSLGWLASQQFADLTDRIPEYKQTLEKKIRILQGMRSGRFAALSDAVKALEMEATSTIPGSASSEGTKDATPKLGTSPSLPLAVEVVPPTNPLGSIESIFGPLANIAVVAVFTIFMLIGREDLRNRFLKLVSGGRLNLMTRALDETTSRINRYLLLQLLVNSGYGVLIGAALYFIGIPNAPLWGAAAVMFRFLPYVGPPLAAAIPILLSLAVFPGWWHALITVSAYVVLELAVANFVEPIVYGSHVGLSPLAILVAAVFWTLIWGFPGLLLSTPLTVCLVVIGRHAPSLSFLNTILGDDPVLTPQAQYYQRLLASDQIEANDVLDSYLKEHSLEDTYSSVVLPALSLVEQDRHRKELDEETGRFVLQSTRDLMEELGTIEEQEEFVNPKDKLQILCLPARDEADAIIAFGLCQLLDQEGFFTSSAGTSTTEEAVAEVSRSMPGVVCISALPPFALGPTKTLYKKLRTEFRSLEIVVCYWQFDGDLARISTRLSIAPSDQLLTTIPQVLDRFRKRKGASLPVDDHSGLSS